MSKEDFRMRVLEQKLFEELKDKPLRNADTIRIKVKDYDIDFTRLYRRLVNYQVEKYGEQIQSFAKVQSWQEETYKRERDRKKKNRKYRGIR